MLTKNGFTKKEIIIPGLKKNYRILQISDAHVVSMDQREEGFFIEEGPHKGKKLTDFGKMRINRFTYEADDTSSRFAALCDHIKEHPDCADAVVFTGDILDFFTESAFSFVSENISRLTLPYMFTLGNHDMIMSRMSNSEVRSRFLGLCNGDTYLQKLKLGELCLIGVDNTDNKYEPHTLSRLDDAMKNEENVLLFQHVPLCTEAYSSYLTRLGCKNYSIGEKGVDPDGSWRDFTNTITSPDSRVKALICGDAHLDHEGPLGGFTQYVSPLSAEAADILFYVHG